MSDLILKSRCQPDVMYEVHVSDCSRMTSRGYRTIIAALELYKSWAEEDEMAIVMGVAALAACAGRIAVLAADGKEGK